MNLSGIGFNANRLILAGFSLIIVFLSARMDSLGQENGYIITRENKIWGGFLKFTNARSTTIQFAKSLSLLKSKIIIGNAVKKDPKINIIVFIPLKQEIKLLVYKNSDRIEIINDDHLAIL